MGLQFTSMTIKHLCEIDVSKLSLPERAEYHRELVIRKEQLEGKLINLGVDPKTLSVENKRHDLKQNVGLLNLIDNTLRRVTS